MCLLVKIKIVIVSKPIHIIPKIGFKNKKENTISLYFTKIFQSNKYQYSIFFSIASILQLDIFFFKKRLNCLNIKYSKLFKY